MHDVRPAAVAGSWYPGSAAALARAVDSHLARASHDRTARPAPGEPCPRALIAPHAGLVYSGPVAAHAYALVPPCGYAAVVLVGPSHFIPFHGVSIWPRGAWESPFGELKVEEALASAITRAGGEIEERPAAHGREHSLELQLPFLGRLLRDVPIVPLVMGSQTRGTAEALGDAIAAAVSAFEARGGERTVPGPPRRVLLIGSSDLSHYEDAATASRMDAVMLRHVEALDPDGLMTALEQEPRHACGGGPMVSVLRAAQALGATRAEVLRYADSGDVSGDKTAVVGYMAAAIW